MARLHSQLRRDEDGIALIVALGVLIVFSVLVAGLASYSSSTARSARFSNSQQNARSIAEAGVNDAVSVLNLPSNNALNSALLGPRTTTFEGGSATWSGTLNQVTATWAVTSTATVSNPSGAAPITKTVTVNVPIIPALAQTLNSQAWNYIYAYRTGNTCDMTISNSVNVGSPLYVEGNLSVSGQIWILGSLIARGKSGVKLTGGSTVLYSSDAIDLAISKFDGQFVTLSWREK